MPTGNAILFRNVRGAWGAYFMAFFFLKYQRSAGWGVFLKCFYGLLFLLDKRTKVASDWEQQSGGNAAGTPGILLLVAEFALLVPGIPIERRERGAPGALCGQG